jgi:hypothetical protein
MRSKFWNKYCPKCCSTTPHEVSYIEQKQVETCQLCSELEEGQDDQ